MKGDFDMIQYSIPGFVKNLQFNLKFIKMMKTAPELFYDDVLVDSIYGNFPDCIMNGGRTTIGIPYSYDQINETFDRIEKEGLNIRLTFSNMLIKPEQFDDEYSNMILKAAQGRNAWVIVYSDKLGDYISSRYHLKRILSTARPLSNVEELNAMLERYDMVVLNYSHNKDYDFLKEVIHPSRLEVMPNELCQNLCPVRQEHYRNESLSQLAHTEATFICRGRCFGLGYTSQTDKSIHLLSNDDIRVLNGRYGINHFKIVGRKLSPNLYLETFAYYFAKPEYQRVMWKIMKPWTKM